MREQPQFVSQADFSPRGVGRPRRCLLPMWRRTPVAQSLPTRRRTPVARVPSEASDARGTQWDSWDLFSVFLSALPDFAACGFLFRCDASRRTQPNVFPLPFAVSSLQSSRAEAHGPRCGTAGRFLSSPLSCLCRCRPLSLLPSPSLASRWSCRIGARPAPWSYHARGALSSRGRPWSLFPCWVAWPFFHAARSLMHTGRASVPRTFLDLDSQTHRQTRAGRGLKDTQTCARASCALPPLAAELRGCRALLVARVPFVPAAFVPSAGTWRSVPAGLPRSVAA